MEAAIAAAAPESHLVEGLNFKLPPSGQYVESKRQVTLQPIGNVFSPLGAKLIRFQIAGSDWMVGETVRLSFNVFNFGASPLVPMSVYPGSIFQRMRILVNSQVVEDVSYYGRLNQMLSHLLPSGKRANDAAEGFGDSQDAGGVTVQPEPLPANTGRRVTMTLLSGLLSQPKWLPLQYMNNFVIELELGDQTSWIDDSVGNSISWRLEDPLLWADVLTLDSGLQNAVAEHALRGSMLPVAFSSFYTQLNTNPGGNPTFQVVLSRGFSRLKGIFNTFYCPPGTGGTLGNVLTKPVSHFWGWHTGPTYTEAQDRFDVFWAVGNRVIPEYHIRSFSEAFYRLMLSIGKYASTETVAISTRDFRRSKFILGVDLETGALQSGGGLAHTGINTRSGELLTLQAKGFSSNQTTAGPEQVYTTLHYDAILSLGLDNTQLLD